jgi:hypothetical protein
MSAGNFWQSEVLKQREDTLLCIMCIRQPVLVWKQWCVIWQVAMLYILLSHLIGSPVLLFKQTVNNSCSDSWKCPYRGHWKMFGWSSSLSSAAFVSATSYLCFYNTELSSCSEIICFHFVVNYHYCKFGIITSRDSCQNAGSSCGPLCYMVGHCVTYIAHETELTLLQLFCSLVVCVWWFGSLGLGLARCCLVQYYICEPETFSHI